MQKETVKYTATIDNRFFENIISGIKTGKHVYTTSEALATMIQKAYNDMVLGNDEWTDVSAAVLGPRFGWYRLKAKKFIDLCEQAGIVETRESGKRRFARVICLKKEKPDDPKISPLPDFHPATLPAARPPRFNFSDTPRDDREGGM